MRKKLGENGGSQYVMVVVRWLVLWITTSRENAVLFYILWLLCALIAYYIVTIRDINYDYTLSTLMIVSWLILILSSMIGG